MSEIALRERPAAPVTPFLRIASRAEFHDAGYGYDVFGLHPPTLSRLIELGAPLYDRYFHVTSEGITNVPAKGPAILVANHGGMLPVDAAMLCFDVLRQLDPPRIPRAIADHFVARLPIVGSLFARAGVVSGTRTNVRHLLEDGELITIFPEGVSGPAKRFRDRYQIQDWVVAFAELAIRHAAPVIPVAILGAEESWPLVARLGLRWFGIPYLPVPAWPIPLPAHYRICYGAPIRFENTPADADDPDIVAAAAARVRLIIEVQLAHLRMERRGIFR